MPLTLFNNHIKFSGILIYVQMYMTGQTYGIARVFSGGEVNGSSTLRGSFLNSSTIAMDFWASLEHTIRYKKNLPINTEIETELKECADSSREWDGKMEHLLHIIT